MLKRSRKTSLLVYAGIPGSTSKRTLVASLKVILKEMSRIESIWFDFSPDLYEKISAFAGLPTPQLKSLRSFSISHKRDMPAFPFGFDHPLPFLEHLDLAEYLSPAIQSMLRPTLKRLSLHRPKPPFTPETFLDALKALPLLTDLSLDYIFIQQHHASYSKNVPFHSTLYIPMLQSLEISDWTSACESFLHGISFPPTTTVTRYHFEFTDEQTTISSLRAVKNTLNMRSSSTPPTSFQSLVTQNRDNMVGGSWDIGTWPTVVETPPMYDDFSKYPFNLYHDFHQNESLAMRETMAVHVFDMLSFHDVRVLTISGNYLNTAVWASLVGSMPEVEKIIMQAYSNPKLLTLMPLRSISKATGDTAGDIIVFPKLKALGLYFSRYNDEGEFPPGVVEQLVCDLEWRRAEGLELESLCVQDWIGVNEEIVDRLMAVVHHLKLNRSIFASESVEE